MPLYYTVNDTPSDLKSYGVEGLETHFIDKNDFINKYNTSVPSELSKRILNNLWANNFGDLSVYVLSSKSTTPNYDFDKLMYNLCNINSTFKVGDSGSMIKIGSYGKFPYVAFYKELNQFDPDFIAFNKSFIPKDIQNLT